MQNRRSPLDVLVGASARSVLRRIMDRTGISPEALAQASGLGLSHIKFLLHGRHGIDPVPQLSTVISVAVGLDMSPVDFVQEIVKEIESRVGGEVGDDAGTGEV